MPTQTRRTLAPLLVLTSLGWALSSVAAEPLPSLDALLKDYKALGLPLPPPEAKLVRYEAGGGGIVYGVVQPTRYGLAFQIKPATKEKAATLLLGTDQWQLYRNQKTQEVDPGPAILGTVSLWDNEKLALAIQCHARGWDKLALILLEESQKKAELPLQNQFVRLAWSYWIDQLGEPKSDRAPVAKRLKELIGKDKEFDTEYNQALLRSLDLALVPSKAKTGSIEALIDDLVDYGNDDSNEESMGYDFDPDDRYSRIAMLGFDAVPALIEHLDDDRLTRVRYIVPLPWHLRVGDVAGSLLESLAGHSIGSEWVPRKQGYRVTKAEAKKWWDQAAKSEKKPTCLNTCFPTSPRMVESP